MKTATKSAAAKTDSAMERRLTDLERKLDAALADNKSLRLDIARFQAPSVAPTPKPAPVDSPYKLVPGHGWTDRAGNRVNVRLNAEGRPVLIEQPQPDRSKTQKEISDEVAARTTAGGGGMGGAPMIQTFRGRRVIQEGSLYRDAATGVIVNMSSGEPDSPPPQPVGPESSYSRQQAIDYAMRKFLENRGSE